MPSQTAQVQIPVLPHVKNLLLSLYGPEPIKVFQNNLAGMELQFIFLNKIKPERINGEKITIQVSYRLSPYFYRFKNAFAMGCYFEKQFNALLFAHIEAQRHCGIRPVNAIKSFFQLYNINEDYYNLQSAMEAYRRIKGKAVLVA